MHKLVKMIFHLVLKRLRYITRDYQISKHTCHFKIFHQFVFNLFSISYNPISLEILHCSVLSISFCRWLWSTNQFFITLSGLFIRSLSLLTFADSDSCRLWLLALMMIPQVVSKQLSAQFLITFVLRYVSFSNLDICMYFDVVVNYSLSVIFISNCSWLKN